MAGAVVGNRCRLVGFDDYSIDGVLEGPLLLTISVDRPGMVGSLGTLLGEHGLNIANLSLGRDERGGTALTIFNLDTPAPPHVVDQVKNADGLMRVLAVMLP